MRKQGRKEAVLLGVFVHREGKAIARRCPLVAIGSLAEAAGDARGYRQLGKLRDGHVVGVGEVPSVLRLRPQADGIDAAADERAGHRLRDHLRKAEIRGAVGHEAVLAREDRRIEKGVVHGPLGARATALGEAEAGGRVALGEVAGHVGAQEVKGHAPPARVPEVAHAVGDRLVGHGKQRRHQLDVVAGSLGLGEELLVGQEQRTGEVVRQVDLEQPLGLGVPQRRSPLAQQPLGQGQPIEQQEPGRRPQLELQELLGQRRRDRQRLAGGVQFANDRAARGKVDDPRAYPESAAQQPLQVAGVQLPLELQVAAQPIGLGLELRKPVVMLL